MSSHEDMVVKEYRICFLVTSDSILKGEKVDAIRDVVTGLQDFCKGASLGRYEVVGNEPNDILKKFIDMVNECDVIVVTGGTGLSSRDKTIETLSRFAEKHIPGFGELFRYLSYKEIGPRAVLSRASAFTYMNRLVFLLPGAPQAVELALRELICSIAPHALFELRR
ncbi:MAG TPA: molybdenum cofactor biosynthesis protein MoaB [Ignisphaera aggregans]|uniref:Molybdenum cofactor biosynthesis protein MoaB n=1 Tax=Ignisphaera aggregans TaxID=334771 RepID=A0A833DV84_9CREN|nr:molybdenum cofactor biosynthesis protein MoaB [Ignisphaera aggregans]